MATLSENDRADLWAEFMRAVSGDTEPFGALTKADIRAAVNALDDYLEANAATINAAIPQPARGALTKQQKARLLTFIIARRYLGDS